MNKKKILLSLGAIVAVVAGVVGMAAFEAHVINVTAHIENALNVHPTAIAFGTVFPEEYTTSQFTVETSTSFDAATRVDDVEYVIKQKPKCICDSAEYTNEQLCPELESMLLLIMPLICVLRFITQWRIFVNSYQRRMRIPADGNDHSHPSYYSNGPDGIPLTADDFCPILQVTNANGVLSKLAQDTTDLWTVDLKVPPIERYVGQDWPASCARFVVPSNDVDYGCDLWIEVTEISPTI